MPGKHREPMFGPNQFDDLAQHAIQHRLEQTNSVNLARIVHHLGIKALDNYDRTAALAQVFDTPLVGEAEEASLLRLLEALGQSDFDPNRQRFALPTGVVMVPNWKPEQGAALLRVWQEGTQVGSGYQRGELIGFLAVDATRAPHLMQPDTLDVTLGTVLPDDTIRQMPLPNRYRP